MTIRNEKWDEWFDKQYTLNTRIRKAIDGLAEGKAEGEREQFKAALWSSVIETGAEEMRSHLNLDNWDETKVEVEGVNENAQT